MMKAILLCLILLGQLSAFNNKNVNINLTSFAKDVSDRNNINIYIDEDLKDKKISLFVPNKIKAAELLSLFKTTVNKLNLNFKKDKNTYYLSKKLSSKSSIHIYNLKYNTVGDCTKILTILKLNFKYLDDSNSFLISSTDKQFKEALVFLNQVDTKQKQVILKIMIYEFNSNQINEKGVQFASIYEDFKDNLTTALNTLVLPLSTNNLTLSNINYYFALRLLEEKKLLNVKQFPYVIAKHNKSFLFEAVENIPYLEKTTSIDSANTSQQDSIVYKDVGLKITGKSFIFKDYITLDIDLVIEDLLTESQSNTPSTYKRHLKSNTDVNYNDVLLLSGIKRNKAQNNNYNIPYLSNIPYLGEMFKYSTKDNQSINITIAIEVLKDIDSNQLIKEISK